MSVRHRLLGQVMAPMITQGIQINHAKDRCVDQFGNFISVEFLIDFRGDRKNVHCQGETTQGGRHIHTAIPLICDAVLPPVENTKPRLSKKPSATFAGAG